MYESVILDAAKVRAIASSTDASPIEITTSAAHGLSTGDQITIFGHTTNTNANGIWTITKVSATQFTLDGSTATGGGAGGATGVWANAPKIHLIEDYETVVLHFDTDGGGDAALTAKLVGSIKEDCPDFCEPQSASNPYDYITLVDYEDESKSLVGDTGFVVATADGHRLFEANINGLRWLTVILTAGTEGELTVRARFFKKGANRT